MSFVEGVRSVAYSVAAITASVIDRAIGTDSQVGNYGLVGGPLGLVPPVGAITLEVWYCGDSKSDNRFGPDPEAVEG